MRHFCHITSDNDGIPDAVEGSDDFDGDGVPNYRDTDSDGDGIPDAVEGIDDADGDGRPNFLDRDADGDSIPDSLEGVDDPDQDGRPNYLDNDSDGDGILDAIEGSLDADSDSIPNYLDLDSDGDSLPDAMESGVDTDGDGRPDFVDTDSDNDGIPDAIEGAVDSDQDGTADYRDLDSDGDGIPDKVEGIIDTDQDNVPDRLDLDSDSDCLSDRKEGAPDWRLAQVNGCSQDLPKQALDSDGDGLLDSYEGTQDVDGDGLPNYLDLDSDGDGILDAEEGSDDPDADSVPNFLDLDSDGDRIPDSIEGGGDLDKDGSPNYLDLDSDGDTIPDSVECRCSQGQPNSPDDADGDGRPNYLDEDSDNDGLVDAIEGTGDDNGNGLPNYVDSNDARRADVIIDSDQDGIPDSIEGSIDTDNDGTPDYLDTDSDNDGIPDEVEGTIDRDLDGISDYIDAVHDEPEPISCRGPNCGSTRRILSSVHSEAQLGFSLLWLLILILPIPCCACVCGTLCRRERCPHCKLPVQKCRAGSLILTINSTLPLPSTNSQSDVKSSVAIASEDFTQEIRLDVSRALQLGAGQTSVHLLKTTHDTKTVLVHLISRQAAKILQRQRALFEMQSSQGTQIKDRADFDTAETGSSKLSVDEMIREFKRQSQDPSSFLMRGKRTCDIVEVQDAQDATPCDQCGKTFKDCDCRCRVCGVRKGACPAICQERCGHCAAPKRICKSGDVEVVLDLAQSQNVVSVEPEALRHALREEVARTLGIHPLQATISIQGEEAGHMRFLVHFITCTQAAWMLRSPGYCVMSMFPAKRQGECACLGRSQLVDAFVTLCQDTSSPLCRGSFFSGLVSVSRKHYAEPHVKCRHCMSDPESCKCVCRGCQASLLACPIECALDTFEFANSSRERPHPQTRRTSHAHATRHPEAVSAQLCLDLQAERSRSKNQLVIAASPFDAEVGQNAVTPNSNSPSHCFGNPAPASFIDLTPRRTQMLLAINEETKRSFGKRHLLPQECKKNTQMDVAVEEDAPELASARENNTDTALETTKRRREIAHIAPQSLSRALPTPPRTFTAVDPGDETTNEEGTEHRTSSSISWLPLSPPRFIETALPGHAATQINAACGRQELQESVALQTLPSLPRPLPTPPKDESPEPPSVCDQDFDRDSHEKERRRLRARSAAAEAIPGGLSGHSGGREARAVGADAWSTNGQGPGSKSALTGLARAGALGAFVGLEVTHEPPHRVVQVDDLVDSNFVRHDEPGYTNPVVDPGDRIIAIDSTMCEHVSVRHVHSAYDAM